MKTERIEFQGHAGDTLAARLDLPELSGLEARKAAGDGDARAYALFAHCFTCGKDIAAARRIAQRLTQAGVGVLRFDFTGLGHSKGEFANTTFSSNVEDLLLAADWLRQNRAAPSIMIGHSLGGAAILAAAPRVPEAKAVVAIAAPFEPGHVLHNIGERVDAIRADGAAEVKLGGRPLTIGKDFVEDVERSRLETALAGLKKALLVMHAPRDATVGVENAAAIFTAAKHPKSYVSLDDADHLISREQDAAYAADVVAAWASRYVDLAAEELHPAGVGSAGPGEDVVRSAEADPEAFLQDLHAGPHHLLADEPRSIGGSDQGPTPYQLVAAGLAACTSMTIRMYARRKSLPLAHVSVDVSHDKIHAEDCETCETKAGKVDVFRRAIRLEGELSDDQRARLLEIADKCPVHRTLESEVKIETALADD